jgi:hypothetical protein
MPEVPQRWHAQNEVPGLGPLLLGCGFNVALAVVLGAMLSLVGPPGSSRGLLLTVAGSVMLGTLLFTPSLIRGSTRAGVWVDRYGLRECYPFGWRRCVRWDQILGVDLRQDGATVQTARGPIELDSKLGDWMVIAAQCLEAVGSRLPRSLDAEAVVQLPAREVEAWLGVEPGQTLTGVSRFRNLPMAAVVAFYSFCMVAEGSSSHWFSIALMLASLLILWSLGFVPTGPQRARQLREIRATGTDLDVRTGAGWHRYAWGGLQNLIQRGAFWVVSTVDGDLWLPPGLTNLDRLLPAIRKAIAAREQGLALPRMTADVPDAAISLSAAAPPSEERGLSRAEDEPCA